MIQTIPKELAQVDTTWTHCSSGHLLIHLLKLTFAQFQMDTRQALLNSKKLTPAQLEVDTCSSRNGHVLKSKCAPVQLEVGTCSTRSGHLPAQLEVYTCQFDICSNCSTRHLNTCSTGHLDTCIAQLDTCSTGCTLAALDTCHEADLRRTD